jgi:hypothetical protein
MKLKALLGIAILVGGAYVAWMMLPPYFANYQFQDDLTTIARFDSVAPQEKPDEDIKNEVLKKAIEHDIKLTGENIQITRDGRNVLIVVNYQVPLEFIGGKTYTLEFSDASDAKAKELVTPTKKQ